MRRVYSEIQIGLISALLLAAVAFEASAAHREQPAAIPALFNFASEFH